MGTTITTIIMTEQSAVLFRLMTWLSPAFPVGAFSYSHGLEWAAENGLELGPERRWKSWIRVGLAQEFGPVSGMLLRRSWTAARARDSAGLLDTLAEARALVATAEFELETTAQGAAFFSTLRKSAQGLSDPGLGRDGIEPDAGTDVLCLCRWGCVGGGRCTPPTCAD